MSSTLPEAPAGHTVDIICAVFNGAPYLAPFLQSIRAQSHTEWRLWVRDDGSTDNSVAIVADYAATDPRILVVDTGNTRLGAVQSFATLFTAVPTNAIYLMFADQDDIWLPNKIASTLAAMTAAEEQGPGPVLVHTDMVVVDEELTPIDPSFWHFANIKNPVPPSLRYLIRRNVVTGATVLVNRALRERCGAIPTGAAVHDWWVACLACAFGRIVALPSATMLYRQHAANAIGAKRPASAMSWYELLREAPGALTRPRKVREGIAAAAGQARAFLAKYGDTLPAADRAFLEAYARIPEQSYLRRKLAVARLHLSAEHGVIQNLGVMLRA